MLANGNLGRLRELMCGLGVPVGCRMKHAKRFKGFKVFKGGKRQALEEAIDV